MGTIHCAIEHGVAELVIDNPARHNAMTLAMWTQLAQAMATLESQSDARVVLLRGAGTKAFVSGADISEFDGQRDSPQGVAVYDEAVARAQGAISGARMPVIAAIEGICYGGGIGLALACDLRLAGRGARFRMPAARLGLGYAYDGVKRMVDLLGPSVAAELLYAARIYDAGAALRMGLVSEVHDDVHGQALAMAREIADNAPMTIAAAKLAIRAVLDPASDARASVDHAVDACFKSADYREGREAFAQKRPPSFAGR